MIKILVLSVGLTVPGLALACGGAKGTLASHDATTPAVHAAVADKDPTACAKKASLVGANCSYTTGMMAQRVFAEGDAWNFTGTLTPSENALRSHVAAPYTVGPDTVHVVANEVLEAITSKGLDGDRVTLDGKRLEVDGVTYFVVTAFSVPNS